ALEWGGGSVLVPTGRDVVGEAWDGLVHSPMELLASAAWMPDDKPVTVRFGLGPGLTSGFGTPDVRAFVQVGAARLVRGPGDADADGLTDDVDVCPQDPEDLDGWEDTDGCPDPDDDADGIV